MDSYTIQPRAVSYSDHSVCHRQKQQHIETVKTCAGDDGLMMGDGDRASTVLERPIGADIAESGLSSTAS